MKTNHVIHWFRRDLRLGDNAALAAATRQEYPVKCVFIFDTQILEELPCKDRRINFIYRQLQDLQHKLQELGSNLFVYKGKPLEVWQELCEDNSLKAVFTNTDYEPYAIRRDVEVAKLLNKKGVLFHTYKDQVIFEKNELLTQTGKPYSVYTPYSNTWKQNLSEASLQFHYVKPNFFKQEPGKMPTLKSLGFEDVDFKAFPIQLPIALANDYAESRDYPSEDSTSHLSTALRFGTLSIRELVRYARGTNEIFLNELIWREFFMQILWHYPSVVLKSFRTKYEAINWRNDEKEFAAWCAGKTGYPIVDAGMRELNETGYMHNRVRMITASFLVKHLLIDWRWGEAYFAEKLLDYDLAANNGNWQWVAGCGTDAAPYFRIFNPESQQKKFDKHFSYVKDWVPEYGTDKYPEPIVAHKFARERCLRAYKEVLN